MDKKMAHEMHLLVNSDHWPRFLKYVEQRKVSLLKEIANAKGEDILKNVGRLKVFLELEDFRETVNSKYEETKHG